MQRIVFTSMIQSIPCKIFQTSESQRYVKEKSKKRVNQILAHAFESKATCKARSKEPLHNQTTHSWIELQPLSWNSDRIMR